MHKFTITFFSILIAFVYDSSAQNIDRTYQGFWGATIWTLELKPNGTFKKRHSGHAGNTIVIGDYTIQGDTIHITSEFQKAYEYVNEYYLMEGDSIIINIRNRYDYKTITIGAKSIYNSKTRKIKYPQVSARNKKEKLELEKVLNLAFNSKEMKKQYQFDTFPNKQLVIAKYESLEANIKVGNVQAIFKPKHEIKDKFYIEFEDINMNQDAINLDLKINHEDINIRFYFKKQNNKWLFETYSM